MKKLRDLRKLDSRGSFTVSGGSYTAWRSFGLPSKSLWLMHAQQRLMVSGDSPSSLCMLNIWYSIWERVFWVGLFSLFFLQYNLGNQRLNKTSPIRLRQVRVGCGYVGLPNCSEHDQSSRLSQVMLGHVTSDYLTGQNMTSPLGSGYTRLGWVMSGYLTGLILILT